MTDKTPQERDDEPRIKTAKEYGCPERIWLQHDLEGTGEPYTEPDGDEVTWCWHQISQYDTEYVRSDLHADALDAQAERIKALEGALRGMIDAAEYWIDREDRRGMSEAQYTAWLALGHHSKAMKLARALLGEK